MTDSPWSHHRRAGIADDIDFEIKGQELQFVEIELDPGESAVAEAGALVWKDAAVEMTTVFGDDAYPAFEDKVAALLHSLVRNHALVDGNKRLAWSAARVFCLLNGRDLTYTVDEAEQMMLEAAARELDVPQIAASLAARMGPATLPCFVK